MIGPFRKLSGFVLAVAMLSAVAVFGGEPESVTIRNVEGRGKTRQLALVDAFRNAISQALGTYVVTSRTWDGETLDKKIFDNSDAVVKQHRVVREEEKKGRCSITIDAEIVRNEMMKFIRKSASTKVGEGELANLLAKREAIGNAVNSLELLFTNWRESIYRVEKCGSFTLDAGDKARGDVVQVSVPFIVTFRWDSYRVFLDKVRNVLSRIAIAKMQGDYNSSQGGDFVEKFFSVYELSGLATKDAEGYVRRTGNANGYGEIRIATRLSDDNYHVEVYIVPNQVKQELDSQLSRESVLRFALKSKTGDSIASQALSGELYSFGWGSICEYCLDLGCSKNSSYQLITFIDRISTEFHRRHWSDQRIYHVSLPVKLEDATHIHDCTITVCPHDRGEDCLDGNSVATSEPMDPNEWLRIDRKPQRPGAVSKSVQKADRNASAKDSPVPSGFGQTCQRRQSTSASAAAESPVEIAEPQETVAPIVITAKERQLKAQVIQLSQLPPGESAARKWIKLARDCESPGLRQAIIKVTAAALVCGKKTGTYKSKVRNQLKDAEAFESSLCVQCPECGGKKSIVRSCSACQGTRACKFANCNRGYHLVLGFIGRGGDHYEACKKCKGSGVCQDCRGRGTETVKCYKCYGEGRSFDAAVSAKTYHHWVDLISKAFE